MNENFPVIKSKTFRTDSNSTASTNMTTASIRKPQTKIEVNEFKAQMTKIIEIKIYLKHNFHKTDIDDTFLTDLDTEYATMYLQKMGMLPTKDLIKKLIKIKPIDKCDFHLTVDQVRNKSIKILHIFPNNKSSSATLKQILSNEEFENVMNKASLQSKETSEDKLLNIKKREIKKEDVYLYMPETVEALINKAKEEILDKRLFLQSHGMIEQQVKVFDLSVENIKKRYMNPTQNLLSNNDYMSNKAKFQNIEKVKKRDILTNDKYEFPYLEINLTKEILAEVNKPIEVPMEIIMKDINFILDNFPIDQLINLDEPLKNDNDNFKEKNYFNTNGIYKNIQQNYVKSTKENVYYKIKSVSKQDVLYVYQKIQTPEVYKLIGLLVNLLYWIVFGFINRIQIDKFTKQQILFKILEELYQLEMSFGNKKTFDKIFMPIFIIIVRIEIDALFQKKFKTFFEDPTNMEKTLERINELITIIFDPNCYFNTFTLLTSNLTKLKHKIDKKLYPNYKSRINATSNLVNQLFTSFKNENNVKKFMKGRELEQPKQINEEGKIIIIY